MATTRRDTVRKQDSVCVTQEREIPCRTRRGIPPQCEDFGEFQPAVSGMGSLDRTRRHHFAHCHAPFSFVSSCFFVVAAANADSVIVYAFNQNEYYAVSFRDKAASP